MIRFAFKDHVEAALAGDRMHHAEWQIETFEHRTLLDVKLDVPERRCHWLALRRFGSDPVQTR